MRCRRTRRVGKICDLAIFVIGRGQRVLSVYEQHSVGMKAADGNGNGHSSRVTQAVNTAVPVELAGNGIHPVYLPKRAPMKRPPRF